MEKLTKAFEWIAVAVLITAFVAGGVAAAVEFGRDRRAAYFRGREVFGRGILLALEILIAADLIRTVALEPTLENIAVLGLIVVVRTVLSFSLDVEIDGVLPWRKNPIGERGAAGVADQDSISAGALPRQTHSR